MKKKQGFTLIELLAVIVILAVIALIATPIVIGIINDSKKKAVDNSANGILKAAEYYYTKSILDSSIVLTGQDNVFDKLEYQGEKPENGITYVTQDGKIALSFKYGDTCYKKDYFDKELTKLDYNIDTCKVSPSNQTLVGGKIVTLATNNVAGLYLDSDGVYRYKGGGCSWPSPSVCGEITEIDNYVKINFEGADYLFQIISIEKEGIKIQGTTKISNQAFDERTSDTEGPRNNSSNTYCQVESGLIYSGCNIYTAINGIYTNGTHSGTVSENSTLFQYLNNSEEATLEVKALRSKAKQNAKWETGFVKNNVIPSQIIEQEKGIIYTATIAIMTATDYLSASLNPSCATGSNFNLPCKGKNWMSKNNPSGNEFTLTPLANSSTGNLWIFGQATPYAYIGSLRQKSSYYNAFIRPVGYLDSNTIFTGGTGTESDPYTLS